MSMGEPAGEARVHVAADDERYETAYVRTSSRQVPREVLKRQSRGWELVAQENGYIRVRLTFRRRKPSHRPKRLLIGAVVACLVILALVVGLMDLRLPGAGNSTNHPSAEAPLDDDDDGIPNQVETTGWSNQSGGPFQTDSTKADTDGDGLSDREEAGAEGSAGTYLGRSDPTRTDTDDDALDDKAEIRGWPITSGGSFVTDPNEVDSDGDGLPDGLEAGELILAPTAPIYAWIADPGDPDTDDDGILDGDEFFLDINPRVSDSDDDGLADDVELDFGSDPTLANGDEDHYSDKDEYESGSDPLAYDLTADERVDAAQAGAKYGDCYSCASGQGLRDEQIESVYYLGGQAGSGVALYGDVRDVAYNLWKREFVAASEAGVGLIPVYGDVAKISLTVTRFAARSERAARVAYEFAQRLPTQVRDRLPSSLLRRGVVVPKELADGPRTSSVYLWNGTLDCPTYVGISNDPTRRAAEHARGGRCFLPQVIEGATALTRGEAHAIEEACIVQAGFGAGGSLQNRIRSIDPSKSYYADAVTWGSSFLEHAGASCA